MKFASRSILIERLRVKVYIGVSEQERRKAQILLFDLICDIEMPSDFVDELSSAVDYVAVVECIQHVCRERPRILLETLGNEIIQAVFMLDVRIARCALTVRKPKKLPELEALGIQLDVLRTGMRRDRLGAKLKFRK